MGRAPVAGRTAWIAWGVLVGVGTGLGAFTFVYAGGGSYLSADPRACANCHVMRQPFDDWSRSTHHAVAGCVDCHLPSGGLAAWGAKLRNGWNHSRAFTLQDFREPIRITPANAAILQESCVRCHGELVHGLLRAREDPRDALACVHCHRSVGHGPTCGLGGPDRGLATELDDAEQRR